MKLDHIVNSSKCNFCCIVRGGYTKGWRPDTDDCEGCRIFLKDKRIYAPSAKDFERELDKKIVYDEVGNSAVVNRSDIRWYLNKRKGLYLSK